MSETMLRIIRIIQPLCCLACIAWLMFVPRRRPPTLENLYYNLTKINLPSILCHYISVSIAIIEHRLNDRPEALYLALLCLDTFVIEDLILKILRLRRRLNAQDSAPSAASSFGEGSASEDEGDNSD